MGSDAFFGAIDRTIDAAGTGARAATAKVKEASRSVNNTDGMLDIAINKTLPNQLPSWMKANGWDVPMPELPGEIKNYVDGKFLDFYAPNEEWEETLYYELPAPKGAPEQGSSGTQASGQKATLRTSGHSFIYLDVGKWGGDDGGKRDFGIVCGRTAVLCTYRDGPYKQGKHPRREGNGSKVDDLTTKLTPGKSPPEEVNAINDLLDHLGKSTKLGKVLVRRYLTATTTLPSDAARNLAKRIYVIVGDMHLAVLDKTSMDPQKDLTLKEAKDSKGKILKERMGRRRRSKVAITDSYLNLFRDPTYLPRQIGKAVGKAMAPPAEDTESWMSDEEAWDWYSLYKEAERFGHAGADLVEFGNLVSSATATICRDVRLLQLGDMFDLWLGFERFFETYPPPPQEWRKPVLRPMEPPLPQARTFVDFWVGKTLEATSQANNIKEFLKLKNAMSMDLLVGNHDSYLGTYIPQTLGNLIGSAPLKPYHYDAETLLLAIHGHQWDGANRNGAMGGLENTQTVMFEPNLARDAEPDGRKPCIQGAVDYYRYKKPEGDFCVFAMGHTHQGVLTEIVIKTKVDPMELKKEAERQKKLEEMKAEADREEANKRRLQTDMRKEQEDQKKKYEGFDPDPNALSKLQEEAKMKELKAEFKREDEFLHPKPPYPKSK